jgi:flagellar basal body-associated protein FliL
VSRVLSILDIASKVMMFIVTLVIAPIALTTAYVMFAPDEFPKPFRLVYNYEGVIMNGPIGGSELTPSEHIPVPEATEAAHEAEPGLMANMSTKIINLADSASRKYIRLTVALEFEHENPEFESLGEEEKLLYEEEFTAKINGRMPMMDDVVITLLSTKTFDDLYTAEGKESLRNEIKTQIQERLTDLHLMGVYFTEFVVQ